MKKKVFGNTKVTRRRQIFLEEGQHERENIFVTYFNKIHHLHNFNVAKIELI